MPSPFPGIDPYVESQGRWPDFHTRFITYCCDALADRLPESYVAQIDERIRLVEPISGDVTLIRPDLVVERRESPPPRPGPTAGAVVLEPVTVPLKVFEEAREARVEILHAADRSLVTVLELLSPSNKTESGMSEYQSKRIQVLANWANLVELDFLAGGLRVPMLEPLPPGDYYAIVVRAERRAVGEVYAWSVRQPLPTIPVPLRPPDPDVLLDLAPIFATAYERGRYDRVIDYTAPLTTSLKRDNRAWAEGRARAPRG
jgi:hypothetical protein